MHKQKPSQFSMRLDDESSDAIVQEEILDRRLEKLGHRITLVAFLIPVLLVVILVLAYLDLTKRVIRFQDTGTTEVESLEKSLDDRFSSLSVQQAKIEEVNTKLAASIVANADKGTRELSALDTRIQKALDHLRQTKTDKATLKEGLKDSLIRIDGAIKPVRKDLKTVSSKLKVLEKKITGELTHLNGSLGDFNELLVDMNKRLVQSTKKLDEMETALSTLSTQKIDAQALHLALDEEKKIYRQMLSLVTKNLEGKLDAIGHKIQALEKQGKIQQQEPSPPTSPKIPLPPPPAKPPETPALRPGPGEIIEQNLQ